MIGAHVHVVKKNKSLINFLAIYCLELLGIENPTAFQIKAMENVLEQESFLLIK